MQRKPVSPAWKKLLLHFDMSSYDEGDVPTFVCCVSAKDEVAKENCRHSSDFLQKLIDAYAGDGGSDFSLDLSDDDDDDSKAIS
jgi:hypothetical protein